MGFRFRRRLRLFPGLSINFSKQGLSSLSIGRPGASINVPLARDGGTRTTVGIPGTGLSWTEEASSKPSQPSADLPDTEIHTGPRGGHWQWRQSRSGRLYKDYLSDQEFLSTSERRQAQRAEPQLPTTQEIVDDVLGCLVGPSQVGDAIWRQGLAQRVLDHPDTPRAVRSAALLIKSPESAELHIRRATSPAATYRAGREVTQAVMAVIKYGKEQGWVSDAEDN